MAFSLRGESIRIECPRIRSTNGSKWFWGIRLIRLKFLSLRKKSELESQVNTSIDKDKMTTLEVKGMSCLHCVIFIIKDLNQLEGIQNS